MGNKSSRPAERRPERPTEVFRCDKCRRAFPRLLEKLVHESFCSSLVVSRPSETSADSDDEISLGGLMLALHLHGELEKLRRLKQLRELLESVQESDSNENGSKPKLGLRVVRGPNWKWGDQDNGEGGMGTVVEIEHFEDSKMVSVLWDCGIKSNYKAGAERSFDLLVIDSVVKHLSVTCDICFPNGGGDFENCIRGLRWKCLECDDFDLCSDCYMSDRHDTTHKFARYEQWGREGSEGFEVGSRLASRRIQSKGLAGGAIVTRGEDWKWGDQDGGRGNTGTITKICGFDDNKARDGVYVKWTDTNNIYRRGHEGKVDLKCTTPANGWNYYPDHLPMLGDFKASESEVTDLSFCIGDKVKMSLPLDVIQEVATSLGVWNDVYVDLFDKVGTVRRIALNNDVLVEFDLESLGIDNPQRVWSFHPIVLETIQEESSLASAPTPSLPGLAEDISRSEQTPSDIPGTSTRETHSIDNPDDVTDDVPDDVSDDVPEGVCQICETEKAIIVFRPCGHQIVCQSCSVPMKKCLTCKTRITEKSLQLVDENKKLMAELNNLKEEKKCGICFDLEKTIAFQPCGHGACGTCASRLNECHLCKAKITGRLKIYL